MANAPTAFIPAAAVTSREAENTTADFGNGCNAPASCAPGIGIATDNPDVSTNSWTLEDQDEDARTPQVSQPIGGNGYISRATNTWPGSGGASGKGTVGIDVLDNPDYDDPTDDPTVDGDATLTTLETGWESA